MRGEVKRVLIMYFMHQCSESLWRCQGDSAEAEVPREAGLKSQAGGEEDNKEQPCHKEGREEVSGYT